MTGAPPRGGGDSAPLGARRLAVVLVSAPWAAPSRPAPTVLRELSRRWGDAVTAVLVEDPSSEELDLWQVESLPTWLRFVSDTNSSPGGASEEGDAAHGAPSAVAGEASPPALSGAAPASAGAPALRLDVLEGTGTDGARVTVPGPWVLVHRRCGAQPKHVVDDEFGPHAPLTWTVLPNVGERRGGGA